MAFHRFARAGGRLILFNFFRMQVKKGDTVKVITGKDKGKSGTVVRALPRERKVVVEGVALFKRHMKSRTGGVGSIVDRSRPIDASNVVRIEK